MRSTAVILSEGSTIELMEFYSHHLLDASTQFSAVYSDSLNLVVVFVCCCCFCLLFLFVFVF